MRMNSKLNFIQPSGGNIHHINHMKLLPLGDGFNPQGTHPILPSGSIWLEANDGQAERLAYQGRTSKFQAKSTEGYAYYTTTISQAYPSATILFVNFETTTVEDSRFITKDSDDTAFNSFFIHVSGVYRISFSLREEFTTNSSNITTTQLFLNVPFSPVMAVQEEPTAVSDGGGQHATGQVILPLQAHSKIFLGALNLTGTGGVVEGGILIEFIRPLDLGSGSNVV